MAYDPNIKRHGHTFVYEPDEAHTPRYFIRDGSNPVVIILHEGDAQAFLNTRAFGTNDWTPHPAPLNLDDAIRKGAAHADRYYERARNETERPSQSDTVERRAWEKIRESRQRREEEKQKGKDRDPGQEREP